MDYKEKRHVSRIEEDIRQEWEHGVDDIYLRATDSPGFPGGSPASITALLTSAYRCLTSSGQYDYDLPLQSRGVERIANDVLRNEAFKKALDEYKSARLRLRVEYRAQLRAWHVAKAKFRARAVRALKAKRMYKVISFFERRYRSDPSEVSAVREEQSGWVYIGNVQGILARLRPGKFVGVSSLENRFLTFLNLTRTPRVHMAQVFRTFRKAGDNCHVYVREYKRVLDVTEKRRRKHRPRYRKNDLQWIMSDWLDSHPVPAKPALSRDLAMYQRKLGEAIMFHRGLHTVQIPIHVDRGEIPVHVPETFVASLHNTLSRDENPDFHEGVTYAEWNAMDEETEDFEWGSRINVTLQSEATADEVIPLRYVNPTPLLATADEAREPALPASLFVSSHLASLTGQLLDLRDGQLRNGAFNLVRSTAELRDTPRLLEPLRMLENTAFRSIDWARLTYGVPAVTRATRAGFTARRSLKFAIACHLAWKFGITPTIQDVKDVLQEGLEWATAYRRGLVQMLAAIRSFVSELTVHSRIHVGSIRSAGDVSTFESPLPRVLRAWNRMPIIDRFTDLPSSLFDDGWYRPEGPLCGALKPNISLDERYSVVSRFVQGCLADRQSPVERFAQINGITQRSKYFFRVKTDALYDALEWDAWSGLLAGVQPLTTTWELLSLSFIIDWFTNSRRLVQNASRMLSIAHKGLSIGEQGIWSTMEFDHLLVDAWRQREYAALTQPLHYAIQLRDVGCSELYTPEEGWEEGKRDAFRFTPSGRGIASAFWPKLTFVATHAEVHRGLIKEVLEVLDQPHAWAGRACIRRPVSPETWEAFAPAIQPNVDFSKLTTLGELIIAPFL